MLTSLTLLMRGVPEALTILAVRLPQSLGEDIYLRPDLPMCVLMSMLGWAWEAVND